MTAQPKPKVKAKPFHLEPQRGSNLATFSLLRAVYMDDFDRAKAILAADQQQLNRQEPFAGLTPLHIAVFRQNFEMVALLAKHRESNVSIKDNFGRLPLDFLSYTSDRRIFDLLMGLAMPEIERAWHDSVFDDGRASGDIVRFPSRLDKDNDLI